LFRHLPSQGKGSNFEPGNHLHYIILFIICNDMKILIKSTHIPLTADLRAYINEKIGALERFTKRLESDGQLKVHVEIGRSTKYHRHGNVYYTEVSMSVEGKTLYADHSDSEIQTAVNQAKMKILTEIKKYKDKKLRNRRQTVRKQ